MHIQTNNIFPVIMYIPSNHQLCKKNYLSVKHALILKNILIMRSLIKELKKSVVTVSLNAVALGLGSVTHTG